MVGWQPFDPAGDPVPVIRKQLCRDSVVPWPCLPYARWNESSGIA